VEGELVGVKQRVPHADLQSVVSVASRDDGQAERARLGQQHDFGPDILAVDLERCSRRRSTAENFPSSFVRRNM
jgi:hypothetical protein